MNESALLPEQLAEWSGGTWDGRPQRPPVAVTTDSRSVPPGSLFVALRGPRFDGHAFVPTACQAGAVAALVARDYRWPVDRGPPPALLRCACPLRALGALGAGYRRSLPVEPVGITGSAGKTTVKEMVAELLCALGPVARTPGNRNNDIGLPLSLLAMAPGSRFGVFEIGMNRPGEIRPLADMLAPRIGIVTNIGPVHLEAFDSVEGIAREKAQLLRALPRDGLAVLDRDDAFHGLLRDACGCETLTVSLDGDATCRAVEYDTLHGMLAVLERDAPRPERIVTGLPGRHNLRNALLATALARRLGVSWAAIREGFLRVKHPPMRWDVSTLAGVTVINDAYNANPMSMRSALETFASLPWGGRRLVLLGDMLELGADNEEAMHLEIGRSVAEFGFDALAAVGPRACAWYRLGAIEAGYPPARLRLCSDPRDAARRLAVELREGDALLLKGSRGMALEQTLAPLAELLGAKAHAAGRSPVSSIG